MTPQSERASPTRISQTGQQWLARCLGLGLLLLALAQLPTFLWQPYVVPKLVVLTILVGLLLLLLGLTLVGSSDEVLKVPWYSLSAVAFLLWSSITALAGNNPGASFLGAVFRYEGVLGFSAYLVVFLSARRLAFIKFLPSRLTLWLAAFGVGTVGLVGVLQRVWPGEAAEGAAFLAGTWSTRSQSTFSNPIILGLFGCLVLPVLIALISERSEGGHQAALVVAASLIAAAAFLGYSRAFWLAAPLGVTLALTLAGWRQSRRWRSAVPSVALAALCVLFALQFGGIAQDKVPVEDSGEGSMSVSGRVGETLGGGGSLRARTELYRGAVALIAERPLLGRGFETYVPEAARTRSEALVRMESHAAYADRPHNSLLYVAYATGLPGLSFYLLFVTGGIAAACHGYQRRTGAEKTLVAGLLGGLFAYLLAEQTLFSTIEVTPLFFAMLGWASASPPAPAAAGPAQRNPVSRVRGYVTLRPSYQKTLAVLSLGSAVVWGAVALPHSINVLVADHTHHELVSQPGSIRAFAESVGKELTAARQDPYTAYYWNTGALMLASAAEQLEQPEQLERAREVLEEGLSFLPRDPTLVISLSDVLFRSGRAKEAVALLVPYLAHDRYQADGHYNLGLVYLALKRPKDALPHLSTAASLNPGDADSHWYLGEAYRALGRSDEARVEQRTAGLLNPEYVPEPQFTAGDSH